MVTRIQAEELVSQIFVMGKTICPDRFPREDPDVMAEWAEIIGPMNFPVQVWPHAVRYWSAEIAGNRMITPKELKQAAKAVLKAWEDDPQWRPILRARRAELERQRDEQIRQGTFGQLRGFHRRELAGPTKPENLASAKQQALQKIREGQARFKETAPGQSESNRKESDQ